MKLILSITAGPHAGKEFEFDGRDTFLVGRVKDAHFKLSFDDPYFSRRHFLLEVNPPRCRLMDFQSRNGTFVNGEKVSVAEIKDGDVIQAGHTKFEVKLEEPDPEQQLTMGITKKVVTPETEPHVPIPPNGEASETIGGYEIIREIGRGGMGIVYEVRRLTDDKRMALKTIMPALGASDKHIKKFVRETEILEKLRHPNIIGFQEVGYEGEIVFLAMDLVTGPDVGKLLADNGPLSVRAAVRIMCQMLAGLYHAHEQGFVHRDIKPGNMLIHSEDGKKTTMLADFGLARAYESSQLSGLTMQGEVGGTPAFLPPEQITHYRTVQPAADQYSAAATLYTLLTQKFVYDLPSGIPQQLLHISLEDPIHIGDRRNDIPTALAEVIHKALKREPSERYADVKEFRTALKAFA